MTDFLFNGPSGPIAGSTTGTGPCLVLVAGLGATRRLWGEFPEVLAKDFTVLTFDNPGVGLSKGGDDFTTDGAADDLIEAVQRLGHDLVSLLGAWGKCPVTYAGGAATIEDVKLVDEAGRGLVDVTVGSALDLFGGSGVCYAELASMSRI